MTIFIKKLKNVLLNKENYNVVEDKSKDDIDKDLEVFELNWVFEYEDIDLDIK